MNITKIKVRKLRENVKSFSNPEDTLIAYISITFDDVFMVHSIKLVINQDRKYFISMPKEKIKDGSFKDLFHAVDNKFRSYILDECINAYCNDNSDMFNRKRRY